MKKRISVLLACLLLAIRFSASAFAEEFDLTGETLRDTQVGWGVFSLPEDLRPQSFVPSGTNDPTENPPAPTSGRFFLPETIGNDYPAASDKSPDETVNEIMERCRQNEPLPLLTTVPIPYIPIGEIDTNYCE